MHIHINTLYYRLKQIKEMTGINPKEAEGTTLFYIGLCLKNRMLSDMDYLEVKNFKKMAYRCYKVHIFPLAL
ncbi:hypothetical protein FFL34_06035 [Lentibacillus cibarius]|uniref:PucR C-terminal helix-turn-helix domain-containing protein n=2 Tax=Lentibacillus cibarius TaxID=2583219 RepID=A0A5S3QIH3_9BACI|nr:hypothetical protein FFL34_06035 [Lentibacillus cibarius]